MISKQEQEEIIDQHYREMYTFLYNYAISVLEDHGLAEEAVQDTFRIACIRPESFLESPNRKGWLVDVLKYTIMNMQRTRARLSRYLVSAMSIEDAENISVEDELDVSISYSGILKQEDFDLLKKIVLEKSTFLEAANTFGISVEACKKRLQRAKKTLKKYLEKNL